MKRIFSILFAGLSILFAWRKTTDRRGAVLAASSFAAVYWVAQAGAILYPGTAAFDPEFVTPTSYILGLALQNYIEIACLVLIGIAAWLALKPRAVQFSVDGSVLKEMEGLGEAGIPGG
jgi:hypothetical protein